MGDENAERYELTTWRGEHAVGWRKRKGMVEVIATCGVEEHAKMIVKALNMLYGDGAFGTSDGSKEWYG